MNTINKTAYLKIALTVLFGTITFLLLTTQTFAATSVTLTSNPTTIVNGQQTTLSWLISGGVTNCSINNGVGAITTSSGSKVVTPSLNNGSTQYILSCGKVTDSSTVNIKPEVNLSFRGGNNITTGFDGNVDRVYIDWNSKYATKCGSTNSPYIKYVSNSGLSQTVPSWMHNGLGSITGYANFNPGHYGQSLSQTSTFYFECENETTGAVGQGSAVLNVTNPNPPGPIRINMWTDTPSVTIPAGGISAEAVVKFTSTNAFTCPYNTFKTFDSNGVEYPKPVGFGWSHESGTSGNYNVDISKTTTFEVTCSRPAATLNGVYYPATSAKSRVTVTVNNSFTNRNTLPPVTVNVSIDDNPLMKESITGVGRSTIRLNAKNTDYCLTRAYDMSGNLLTWPNHVNGWDRNNPNVPWGLIVATNGTINYSRDIEIPQDTRFVAECRREADYNSSNPTLRDLGSETYELVANVQDSDVPPPQAEVKVYGNAIVMDNVQMLNSNTQISGFTNNTGWSGYLEGSKGRINSITFPVNHPSGGSDNYDIYLNACDTVSNLSQFKLFRNGVEIGNMDTNNPPSSQSVHCFSQGYLPIYPHLIASNINISDGDSIRVECVARGTNFGSDCHLAGILFGANSPVSTPINENSGFADMSILWIAQNVSSCGNLHQANGVSGISYSWTSRGFLDSWMPNPNYGYSLGNSILEATEFKVRCQQGSRQHEGVLTANIAGMETNLVAEAEVITGQCLDVNNIITNISPGYIVDRDGRCVPALDLAAENPASSVAGAIEDGVNGTYDNLNILLLIRNLGPGSLLANSNVSYMANISPDARLSGSSIINSSIGYFNNDLSGNVFPIDSSTLTRSFDNVPFGTHNVCSRVNLDGNPNVPENNPDLSNNTSCSQIILPVPRPPMSITTDREVIRSGQSAEIAWSVNVTYELECTVRGAGVLNQSFNTLSSVNPYTGSYTVNSLTSTSQYTLQCTEPITGTSFVETLVIETVPAYEEI